MNVKCLLGAFTKLRHDFNRKNIDFHGVAFIRNDVLELLIDSMPDRGKLAKAVIDWTYEELLRELLRRRFVMNLNSRELTFDAIWRRVAETHILGGQESSNYLLRRSLMRPRALIELIGHCRSHAINLGHDKILEMDFIHGETAYSTDLVNQIGLELQDIFKGSEDTLYSLIEAPNLLDGNQLRARLSRTSIDISRTDELIELLLWYGVIGFLRQSGDETYIYDVNYDMKKLKALMTMRPVTDLVYVINPAFWRG